MLIEWLKNKKLESTKEANIRKMNNAKKMAEKQKLESTEEANIKKINIAKNGRKANNGKFRRSKY